MTSRDRDDAVATIVVVCVLVVMMSPGCDEQHEWDNMYDQPRYETYEPSTLFESGTSVQYPPDGTVARDDQWRTSAPPLETITLAQVQRGRERFNISCTPCHGHAGYGDGMVVMHGFPQPPSLHEERLRKAPDAYLEHVITHGLGKMPSYASQVSVEELPGLVAYVRALQRSQHATMTDVPTTERSTLDETSDHEDGES